MKEEKLMLLLAYVGLASKGLLDKTIQKRMLQEIGEPFNILAEAAVEAADYAERIYKERLKARKDKENELKKILEAAQTKEVNNFTSEADLENILREIFSK